MRVLFSLLLMSFLAGCQMLQPVPLPPEPVVDIQPQPLPEEPEISVQPEKKLTLDNDAQTLQAWVNYRALLLQQPLAVSEAQSRQDETEPVWQLKRILLQLHPDKPYLTRLRIQMQLLEYLHTLPEGLAELLNWDLAVNQKLLEAESAVSALTRINAQQNESIERLQKTNKELQKKIDALTQIEAQLNQQVKEDTNGQPR